MLLTVLAPFLLFSNALGVLLQVIPATPPANSNVQINWTIENFGTPLAPHDFTLVLHGPNNPPFLFITVNGRRGGIEEMAVGPESSYKLEVWSPIANPNINVANGITSFEVVPHTSTSSPSQQATPSTSLSSTISKITSNAGESGANGETQNRDSGTIDTSTAIAVATTTSSTDSAKLSAPPSNSTRGPSAAETGTDLQAGSSSFASSSSPSSSPSPASSTSSSSKRGVIIGSVIGSLAFFILLATILFCLRKRRKQQSERPATFHRDMMVRVPGPTLYALSSEPSSGGGVMSTEEEKGGYLITAMDDASSISDESGYEQQHVITTPP